MCDMDVNSRFKVKNSQHVNVNGVDMCWHCCPQEWGRTNVAPANLEKKQNVSSCASCYRINSHHPTDHDRTLLRLQLHWLCGLRSSQNHRTLLEFICFAFGNNQPDVQSLSKLSRMFFVWLFIVGLWQMWWFGNFGAKKTTIQQQKDAVWHIISNPLDPTRRTNEDPPIPSLYWHGHQVMHLSTVHTNYM